MRRCGGERHPVLREGLLADPGRAIARRARLWDGVGRELRYLPGVETAQEGVGVREPELLKLEHRTGARGFGVSRTVRDDQRVPGRILRPRLDAVVRHVDGAADDGVAGAAARIEDDRLLARVAPLLHLFGRDATGHLHVEGRRLVRGAERCHEAAGNYEPDGYPGKSQHGPGRIPVAHVASTLRRILWTVRPHPW